jgi:hypothetical protein
MEESGIWSVAGLPISIGICDSIIWSPGREGESEGEGGEEERGVTHVNPVCRLTPASIVEMASASKA